MCHISLPTYVYSDRLILLGCSNFEFLFYRNLRRRHEHVCQPHAPQLRGPRRTVHICLVRLSYLQSGRNKWFLCQYSILFYVEDGDDVIAMLACQTTRVGQKSDHKEVSCADAASYVKFFCLNRTTMASLLTHLKSLYLLEHFDRLDFDRHVNTLFSEICGKAKNDGPLGTPSKEQDL